MGSVSFHRRRGGEKGSVSRVDFCEPHLNILAHAQAIELDIGSRCGGHGKCGGDRVRVLDRSSALLSPITEDEKRHLTQEELNDGIRLGCQCFPESSDAVIDFEVLT